MCKVIVVRYCSCAATYDFLSDGRFRLISWFVHSCRNKASCEITRVFDSDELNGKKHSYNLCRSRMRVGTRKKAFSIILL